MNDILKTLRFFVIIGIIFYILAYGFLFFIKYIFPLIILYTLFMIFLKMVNINFIFRKKRKTSKENQSQNDVIDAEFEDLD